MEQLIKQAREAERGVVEGASDSETGDVSTANRLMRWWELWTINLRKAIPTEVKLVKRRMVRSYRQRLCRLHERLHAALLTVRISPIRRVPSAATVGTDTIDVESDSNADENTPKDIRRRVAKCRLQWQRAKWERLVSRQSYCPGQLTRRFFARVSTKY